MPRRTLSLTEDQRRELLELRDHDPRPYVRERGAALLKIADGLSPHRVARQGLLKPRDPDTVYAWMDLYLASGVAGLIAHPQGGSRGRPPGDPEPLLERLRHGPGEEARQEMAVTDTTPPPSRWTLRTIRVTFDRFRGLTLSGVARALERCGIALRSGVVQQYSPDPDYVSKRDNLYKFMAEAAGMPDRVALVFLDEMGYARWPEPAADWTGRAPAAPPLADRAGGPNRLWRVIGAMNAVTGRVDFLDDYIVGRAKVIKFYEQLNRAYPDAERLLVVQDNWSIHTHEDVLGALKQWPRIEPVWLPTYAPWLNPIEKLWRWLRQDVLKLHRLAGDWAALRGRVNQFLGQFAAGSEDLLRYVGLRGKGKLAQALRVPP